MLKERQSPSCTILMGQRLRDREGEFSPNSKHDTANPNKSLISIGQCCSWVEEHYPSNIFFR